MQLTLLKAKLHKAHVTQVELEYEGSCAIDKSMVCKKTSNLEVCRCQQNHPPTSSMEVEAVPSEAA